MEELLATEGAIRKKRQKMIYEQKERQRKLMEIIGWTIGVALLGGFIMWLVGLAMKAQGVL